MDRRQRGGGAAAVAPPPGGARGGSSCAPSVGCSAPTPSTTSRRADRWPVRVHARLREAAPGARAADRGAQATRRRRARSTSSAELRALQAKLDSAAGGHLPHLTPMQRVMVARHPRRPYTLDYLSTIFTDFIELHGDRLYRDDPRSSGGWARLRRHLGHGDRPPEGPRHQGEHQAQLRHAPPRGLPEGAPPDEARRRASTRRSSRSSTRRAPIPASAPRSAASPRRSRATSSRCRCCRPRSSAW